MGWEDAGQSRYGTDTLFVPSNVTLPGISPSFLLIMVGGGRYVFLGAMLVSISGSIDGNVDMVWVAE